MDQAPSVPPPVSGRQATAEPGQLRLLSIFHYLLGGLAILGGGLALLEATVTLKLAADPGWMEKSALIHWIDRWSPWQDPHTAVPSASPTDGITPEPTATATPDPTSQPPVALPPEIIHAQLWRAGTRLATYWLGGALLIVSGWNLHRHRHRVFSLAVAAGCCLYFPFGTVLGLVTIGLLSRPSVRQLYLLPAGSTPVPTDSPL